MRIRGLRTKTIGLQEHFKMLIGKKKCGKSRLKTSREKQKEGWPKKRRRGITSFGFKMRSTTLACKSKKKTSRGRIGSWTT